jgi:hypothetical protein
MPFNIVFERLPQYVRYEASGPASLQNYADLIDRAARETLAARDRLVMVDLRGVIGRLAFSDQFFIGELVVRQLQHVARLATVVPDEPASYNSQKVANRHEFSMRGFRSEDEARSWLLEGR